MKADVTSALVERISGEVIWEDTPGYDAARRVWNGLIDRRPLAIVRLHRAH